MGSLNNVTSIGGQSYSTDKFRVELELSLLIGGALKWVSLLLEGSSPQELFMGNGKHQQKEPSTGIGVVSVL